MTKAKKNPAKKAKKAPIKKAEAKPVHDSTLCHIMKRITQIYACKVHLGEVYAYPLLMVLVRVAMGYVFFVSGILKLPADFLGIGQGDWSTTILLFEYEHPVPFLSPVIAAYLGTAMEILAPVLLLVGLGTRFAAAGLLFMTAIIEFTYQHSMDHVYWGLLLAVILIQGAGIVSLDHVIKKKYLSA
jgi:putative oxidoreductase